MAELGMKFHVGEAAAQREAEIERKLWGIQQRVERTASSLSANIKYSSQIHRQMQQIVCQLERERNKVSAMRRALNTIMEQYRSTENRVIGAAWAGICADSPAGGQNQNPGGQAPTQNSKPEWLVFLERILGECGIFAAIPMLTTKWQKEGVFSNLKHLSKIIGSGAEAVTSHGIDWKSLLGMPLAADLKEIKPDLKTMISYGVDSEFGDYVFDLQKTGAAKCADKFKVAAKWAGSLFTVASDVYQNYQEHGGMGSSRFWQETVTESAIDLGKDALIGIAAGVGTAAVAAAAGVTAPVWIAGAAGIAVTVTLDWALDGVTKLVTGDSKATFTECVSDAIWDGLAAIF